jgi:hypothetical protein
MQTQGIIQRPFTAPVKADPPNLPAAAQDNHLPVATQAAVDPHDLRINFAELIRDKVNAGEDIGKERFARMAAEALLQDYDVARAETTLSPAASMRLFAANIASFLSENIIPAALLSGLAVDLLIYGGAVTTMIAANPLFAGLALGSVLAGYLIGKTKGMERGIATGLIGFTVAMASYYFASSNPDFTSLISQKLSFLDPSYNAAHAQHQALIGEKALYEGKLGELQQMFQNGQSGKPVDIDGYAANDWIYKNTGDLGDKINIPRAEGKIAELTQKISAIAPQVGELAEKRPSTYIGLGLGTAYLASWLGMALMTVGNIVRNGREWKKEAHSDAARFKEKKDLIRSLHGNDARVLSRASAKLEQLGEIYISGFARRHGAAEARKLRESFFSDRNFGEMTQQAGALFRDAVPKGPPPAAGFSLRRPSQKSGEATSRKGITLPEYAVH